MHPLTWAIIIIVALIIFFIIIGIIFASFKPDTTAQIPADLAAYDQLAIWGPNETGPDSSRNTCQVYNFDGAMVTIDGQLTAMPAEPSLSPAILDAKTPAVPGVCYDLDQIVAAQVVHTCNTVQNIQAGDIIGTNAAGQKGISFCVKSDATRAAPGTSENYYAQDSSIFDANGVNTSQLSCDIPPCQGILSLLAFNYQPNQTQQIYDNALCLSIQSPTDFVGKTCDISDRTQLVRMSRYNASADTTSTGGGQQPITSGGKSGVITNLLDRDTGQCIISDASNNLMLDPDCNRYWALVPNLYGTKETSPQQIVYIKNLTADQIAQFNATLSYDKLLSLIASLNLYSIQLNSATDPTLVLKPFSTDKNDTLASFQYVNYAVFNSVLFTSAPSIF